MSVEANEEAVRKHIDLSWNKAEFGALAEVWSLGAVVHLWDGNDLSLAWTRSRSTFALPCWLDRTPLRDRGPGR